MNVLIIPDSFKGTLSAKNVAKSMSKGVKKAFSESTTKLLPFSDGGEGAISLLRKRLNGKVVKVNTINSVGAPIEAPLFWIDKNKIAWIELSQCSGISQLSDNMKNPMKTSTYGTGIQIMKALEKGCKKLYIGLGGSSTHDLGTGIFSALGGKLLDKNSSPIKKGGQGLIDCEKIILSTLTRKLLGCKIILGVDVQNKLLGKKGAAKVYGSQKGATPKMIKILEKGSSKIASVIYNKTGKVIDKIKGGGAAGGAGAGLYGLLNAEIKSGFDLLSEIVSLEKEIITSDLIITGEGCLDNQSVYGKLPQKVGELAIKHNKPLICIAGEIKLPKSKIEKIGITSAWSINPKKMSIKTIISKTPGLIERTTEKAIKSHLN